MFAHRYLIIIQSNTHLHGSPEKRLEKSVVRLGGENKKKRYREDGQHQVQGEKKDGGGGGFKRKDSRNLRIQTTARPILREVPKFAMTTTWI